MSISDEIEFSDQTEERVKGRREGRRDGGMEWKTIELECRAERSGSLKLK